MTALGVVGEGRLLRLGVGFSLVGRGARIGGILLRLMQLRILGGEIVPQAVDLGLHLGAQGLNLLLRPKAPAGRRVS